jgi:hypothetical protein
MSEIPPVLLSAIICDRVIFDKITGMPTLVSIIQVMNAAKFPVRTHSLCFFCELTNGHGKTKTMIRLVDVEQDEKVVMEQNGIIEFGDVNQMLTLAVNLQGIVFPHPGEYRFQLFTENELLGERKLLCRQVDAPHNQDGGEMKQ